MLGSKARCTVPPRPALPRRLLPLGNPPRDSRPAGVVSKQINVIPMLKLVLFFALVLPAAAVEPVKATSMRWVHIGVAVNASGSAFDAWSSWKRPEASPFLSESSGPYQGTFHRRGAVIKGAAFAGVAAATELIAWKIPKTRRAMALLNGILGGGYFAAGGRNLQARGAALR